MLIGAIVFALTLFSFALVGFTIGKHVIRFQLGIPGFILIGGVGLMGILAWLSLFMPLGLALQIGLFVLIALTAILQYNALKHLVMGTLRRARQNKWKSGLLIGAALLMIYALAAQITLYDSGLYHVQNIKWITDYTVVPGLGNIHGRFAFNSHAFLLYAPFSVNTVIADKEVLVYPVNAVMLFAFLIFVLNLIIKKFHLANYAWAVGYSMLVLWCVALYPGWIGAPSPDSIGALLVMLTLIIFFENLGSETKDVVLLLVLLICAAIVVKLSNVFLVAVLLPVLFRSFHVFPLKKTILLALFFALPFLSRNFILSGYLLYPAEQTATGVSWQIPKAMVKAERNHISTWAKVPRVDDTAVEAMSWQEWLPIWWQRKSMPFKLLLFVNMLLIPATLIAALMKKREAALGLIILLNLAFWFFSAPDPRFVHGFLLMGFVLTTAVIFQFIPSFNNLLKRVTPTFGYVLAVVITLGAFFTVHEKPLDMLTNHFTFPKQMASNPLEKRSAPFPHVVPVGNNRCYNAGLPCLPEENQSIQRVEFGSRFGFVALENEE